MTTKKQIEEQEAQAVADYLTGFARFEAGKVYVTQSSYDGTTYKTYFHVLKRTPKTIRIVKSMSPDWNDQHSRSVWKETTVHIRRDEQQKSETFTYSNYYYWVTAKKTVKVEGNFWIETDVSKH